MPRHCITKWLFLVVLAVGSLRSTISLEEMDCAKHKKSCVLVTQCVSALDLLKANATVPLKNAFCGYDVRGPKVCCPIDSPIVFNYDTETTTSRVKTIPKTTTMATTSTTEAVDQYGLPSRQECGLSYANQNRIVGGDIASIEEFPWLARIRGKRGHSTKYLCGGSLISQHYILTAGHCVYNVQNLGVRLGEWDTETTLDCQDGTCSDPPVDIKVSKAILHPLYNSTSLEYDIALLLLAKAAKFTDYIRPVCLPTTRFTISRDYVAGTKFWTAGWGITEFDAVSMVKRKVDLDTVPIDVCVKKIPKVESLFPNVICAGGTIGKDTCNGDSGGPLVKQIEEESVNWYLYGITSFGARRCGVTDLPSVYTRVTSYMDWIKENIVT